MVNLSDASFLPAPRSQPVPGPRPSHRALRRGRWWRSLTPWQDVSEEQFRDHRWQNRWAVRSEDRVIELLGDYLDPAFVDDVRDGIARSPMKIRLTPYVLSLIDWADPTHDPVRRQFLPLGSEQEPDHPMARLDALAEQQDAVTPGLVHRYPDKVLFLALDVCPVYCRYCTRSYSIGGDTEQVEKRCFRPARRRWAKVFEYLRAHSEVEDVVVSGGDLSMLGGEALAHIGHELLAIPNIRRIRLATKALAVLPQKVLNDDAWTEALLDIVDTGRERGVHVCVHTHFNHPKEITEITADACALLFQEGVVVRNQSVLLRGVNDDLDTMTRLVRRLAWVNVQPYYVYVHDLIPGVETLRTSLATGIELEKQVRGRTAGFMTPTFVCDTAGGGGKRALHSYELYDEDRGVAVYRSPVVDPERLFFHFDPLRSLPPSVRKAWLHSELSQAMVQAAVRAADL